MAVDSVLVRILKIAMAKGTTWGTCVAFGAGDEMHPQDISGLDKDIPNNPDKGAGYGLLSGSHQGSEGLPAPGFTLWPYEADDKWLLGLGCIFGEDVVTGAADPYTHTMEMQEEANDFVSVGWQEGDEVKHLASLKFDGLVVEPNTNGIIEFKFTGKGNQVALGTNTDLDTVSGVSSESPYTFKNLVFRINDQDGIALASGDALDITHFVFEIPRPSESNVESGGGEYSEPVQGEYPEPRLTIRVDKKNAAVKALFTDWTDETLKKGDIVVSGTSASRELKFQFPAMKIEKVVFPRDTKIGAELTFLLQRATAAPTGMTGVDNTAIIKTSVTTAVV